MSNGFVHSAKVPKIYKEAASIVRSVREKGASLKTLVYKRKYGSVARLHALTVHTLQRGTQIDRLIRKTRILLDHPRLDPWLARVLIAELLWGSQYFCDDKSKPVQTILAYEDALRKELSHFAEIEQSLSLANPVTKPRYVRINTLLLSVEEAIRSFQQEGWTLLPRSYNYQSYLESLSRLPRFHFIQDFHLAELFAFPPETPFHQHDSYINGKLILQDKASCLPSYLLNPAPGSVVLDMCAAPGMKTSHLSAIMENKGKIYAVEKDEERFVTLCEQIKKTDSFCVKPLNIDSLTLDYNRCPDVEYILVDPSCSGSGMVTRIKLHEDDGKFDPARLKHLQNFQVVILSHALRSFPNAKKVVYSTCSIHPEENEQVVDDVLKNVGNTFRLVSLKNVFGDTWLHYSSLDYDCKNNCLYAVPEVDHCNGFFIAVFERNFDVPFSDAVSQEKVSEVENVEERVEEEKKEETKRKEKTNEKKKKKKKRRKKRRKCEEAAESKTTKDTSEVSEKVLDRKQDIEENQPDVSSQGIVDNEQPEERMEISLENTVEEKPRKKKKKRDVEFQEVSNTEQEKEKDVSIPETLDSGQPEQETEIACTDTMNEKPSKKKKKKKDTSQEVSNNEQENEEKLDIMDKISKKKKKKSKISEDVGTEQETVKDDIPQETSDERCSKKKKKKRKADISSEETAHNEQVEESHETQDVLPEETFAKPPKKRKKKRSEDLSNIENVVQPEQIDNVSLQEIPESKPPKKKKKKRDVSNEICDNAQLEQEKNIDISPENNLKKTAENIEDENVSPSDVLNGEKPNEEPERNDVSHQEPLHETCTQKKTNKENRKSAEREEAISVEPEVSPVILPDTSTIENSSQKEDQTSKKEIEVIEIDEDSQDIQIVYLEGPVKRKKRKDDKES